jgi:alpha-D-xyloside xylohydrolase
MIFFKQHFLKNISMCISKSIQGMKKSYLILMTFFITSVLTDGQQKVSYKLSEEEIDVSLPGGTLNILPIDDNAMRIRFFESAPLKDTELIFIRFSKKPVFKVTEDPDALVVKGKKITVTVDKKSGVLSFSDDKGIVFLKEKEGTRQLVPGYVGGEPCFIAEQSFVSPADEYLFGLGQFQDGHFNIRNITRRLTQVNSQIAVPFIYSSKGYGLLWHQYGLTDFNPADNLISLEKQENLTMNNQAADVSTTAGAQRRTQNQSVYTGTFKVPASGTYSLFVDYGNMENRHFVTIDNTPLIDQSNMWLPPAVSTLLNLTSGEHRIQLSCKATNIPKVSWKLVGDLTTFRSPNAKILDYIVFYGPSADDVIATYRDLSGNVPLLPLWAYGFWQCRERYSSGNQLVETVKEFRKRNLPVDVIVQDWQYWGNNGWGVPQFDIINYPDPAGFIKELHDLNAHFNISIWSNPDKNSEIGKEFMKKNLYIPETPWLDYFNPLTREAYWNTLRDNLFTYGVDSWWMDATEPENDALHGKNTFIGPGDFYRLTYPLMVSRSVYEGQRNTSTGKRACILTRSAFPGQQRYGTINWSGDVGSTWDAFRRQIVGGLNYNITGMPYWTTDIGGFFRPGNSQYTDEKYHELLIRWYQMGAFNPIFRIHGFQSETEPWKYGPRVEENMRTILELRYRLLSYIYSESYQVTKNGSTMMRPLVMDFRNDIKAVNQPYEYMFGKSFLVAPVTEPDIVVWDVYLPQEAYWYDFWSGQKYNGGQTIKTKAPLNIIPLFVRTGSIVPVGKNIQFTGQLPADTLEIRIYEGADGRFDLYEDENDNYNYEKGVFSIIPFSWNDTSRTLSIGKRNGEFPGMLKKRVFRLVLVSPAAGAGIEFSDNFQTEIFYNGKEKHITLK